MPNIPNLRESPGKIGAERGDMESLTGNSRGAAGLEGSELEHAGPHFPNPNLQLGWKG